MIKALGQTGLDFIANKFKELKALVDKKADKTEIITQEERKQLEIQRNNYVSITVGDFESKLKLASDCVKKYHNAKHLKLFNFVDEVMNGTITPPEGTQNPYLYSLQSWLLKDATWKAYVICDMNMQPLSVDKIAQMAKDSPELCLVHEIVLDGIDAYFSANRALNITNEYFVKQETGKVLSSNDYTNDDKAKVQNIPAVVDNLTTDDATKALSAKQGKALQDNKANKSDISRCKVHGYNTSDTWLPLENTRDLEDWIGDLDYRTRELKSNKGLTGASSEIKQQSIESSTASNCNLQAMKWGRIVELVFNYIYDENSTSASDWTFTIPRDFVPGTAVNGVMLNGEFEVVPKDDGSDARMIVRKVYGLHGGRIAGNVMYLSRYR